MRAEKDIEQMLDYHETSAKWFKKRAQRSRNRHDDLKAASLMKEAAKHDSAAKAMLWVLDLPF